MTLRCPECGRFHAGACGNIVHATPPSAAPAYQTRTQPPARRLGIYVAPPVAQVKSHGGFGRKRS